MGANCLLFTTFLVYFSVPVGVVGEKSIFDLIFSFPAAKNFFDAFRENGSQHQALESLDAFVEMTDGMLLFLRSKVGQTCFESSRCMRHSYNFATNNRIL